MPFIPEGKESVYFVGGRGTKAGDANAGGCLKSLWGNLWSPDKILADVMNTNGGPLSHADAWNGSGTACTVSSDGGNFRLTLSGKFANCIVGLIANVFFDPGTYPGGFLDGHYEVIATDGSDYITIDEPHTVDGLADIKVGGAFDKIQTASDETTATYGLEGYTVNILTNKAETLVGNSIDIDAGGGLFDDDSWKKIIGIDDNGVELDKSYYVTIDGDNQNQHIFSIDDIDNISFHHVFAYNPGTNFYGYYYTNSAAHYNFLLNDCKATAGKYGIFVTNSYTRSFAILGGEYEGNTAAIVIQAIIGGMIRDVNCYSPGTYVVYVGYWGVTIQDSIFRSDGTGYGLHLTSDNFALVTGNVFYNITNGILVNSTKTHLVQYDNIFVLSSKSTGKFIIKNNGVISVNDYSCGWAMDGAPEASGRWGDKGIGEHSIEQDPLFFDAANLDFRLKMNSPCRRIGRPTLGKL